MEQLYNVVVNKGVDLEKLDQQLAASSGTDTVPNRPVNLGNPLNGNYRTTQWFLTEDEAIELRKDERVLDVSVVDNTRLKLFGSGSVPCKMYRGFDAHAQEKLRYDNNDPVRVVNWGLGRHKEYHDTVTIEEGIDYHLYASQGDATAGLELYGSYGDVYTYDHDGEGVDVVILDTGIDAEHPEWNDANGVSRLKQIDWIAETGLEIFDDEGNTVTQDPLFYTDQDGHGSSCASLAAGYLNGHAKGADIYAIKIKELDPEGRGYSVLDAFSLLNAWHNQKTNGRPTVVNMSFGASAITYIPIQGLYRGGLWQRWLSNPNGGATLNISAAEIAYNTGLKGLQSNGFGSYGDTATDPTYVSQYFELPVQNPSYDAAVEQMIDDGIHVCIAAGNHGGKLDVDINHEDYVQRSRYFGTKGIGSDWDNACLAQDRFGDILNVYYYNRPPSPYHPKCFKVGALAEGKVANTDVWGEYDWDSGMYTTTGQFGEFTTTNAREDHIANANEYKPDFSAHGNAVDIYAAGDSVWSAVPLKRLYNFRGTGSEGLHLPDRWDVHLNSYEVNPNNTLGLDVVVDTTSRSDRIRVYFQLSQQLIDDLISHGVTTLYNIRSTLHTDRGVTELKDMVNTVGTVPIASNLFDSDAYRNSFLTHDGANNPDPDFLIIDETGNYVNRPKLVSRFERRVSDGTLYAYSDYMPRNANTNYTAHPLDLTDANNVGRTLFELTLWKDDYTDDYDDAAQTLYGVPLAELLTPSSVAINFIGDSERANHVDNEFDAGTPYVGGHAYKQYTGTSMASPNVAGMLAVSLERDGHKTPEELKDFTLTPYSGYIQKGLPDDNNQLNRISPPESANIGHKKINLEYPLWDGSSLKDDEWIVDWHSRYTSIDARDDLTDTVGFVPHNHMIIGSKALAVSTPQRKDYTYEIEGNFQFYSGAYEKHSSVMVESTEDTPLHQYHIASGETRNANLRINGDTYGGSAPLEQDGQWIPKELFTDLTGSIGVPEHQGGNLYTSSFTHDLNIESSTLTPIRFTGKLLRGMDSTFLTNLYPRKPLLDQTNYTVDFLENVQDDSITGLDVLTPVVDSTTASTLVVEPVDDHIYFTVNNAGDKIVNDQGLDFENAQMPNPLQFKFHAVDVWGQKSDTATVTVNVIDTADNPPVYTSDVPSVANVTEGNATNILMFQTSVTDGDHDLSQLEVKLTVGDYNSVDNPDEIEAMGLIFNDDPSDITLHVAAGMDFEGDLLHSVWGDPINGNYRNLFVSLKVTDPSGGLAQEQCTLRLWNAADVQVETLVAYQLQAPMPEDTQVGHVLDIVHVTDNDDAPYSYLNVTNQHSQNDPTLNETALDVNVNGEIYLKEPLDYEQHTNCYMKVRVRNRYGTTTLLDVTSAITDVFDTPPEFLYSETDEPIGTADGVQTIALPIDEHQDAGNLVWRFKTDSQSTFSYSVVVISGNIDNTAQINGNYFDLTKIDGTPLGNSEVNEGMLVINNKFFPDFEDDAQWKVVITATNNFGSNNLEILPLIQDTTADETLEVVDISNSGTPYEFEVDSGTVSGTDLFTITFSEDIIPVGDYLFLHGSQSSGSPYGDTSGTIVGLNIDKTTGVVSLSADADYDNRSLYEFVVIARSAITGAIIQQLITIKVNEPLFGAEILNEFAPVEILAASAQTAKYSVVDFPFDIGSDSNRRLYFAMNPTIGGTSYWQHDLCIAGVQILDENGNVVHNIYANSASHVTNWQGGSRNDASVVLPSVASAYTYAQVDNGSAGNKWHIRSSTGSSNTGANGGFHGMNHMGAFPVGYEVLNQLTSSYFLFREMSGGSGVNYVRTNQLAMPAKGSVRLAYHHYTQQTGFEPNNTLFIGMQ